MADKVINMSDLTINKNLCKFKDLYFKTATKPYTRPLPTSKTKHYEKNIDTINWNFDYVL